MKSFGLGLLLMLSGCSWTKDNAIETMVKYGANPLDAKCAMLETGDSPDYMEICKYRAVFSQRR